MSVRRCGCYSFRASVNKGGSTITSFINWIHAIARMIFHSIHMLSDAFLIDNTSSMFVSFYSESWHTFLSSTVSSASGLFTTREYWEQPHTTGTAETILDVLPAAIFTCTGRCPSPRSQHEIRRRGWLQTARRTPSPHPAYTNCKRCTYFIRTVVLFIDSMVRQCIANEMKHVVSNIDKTYTSQFDVTYCKINIIFKRVKMLFILFEI